MPPLGRGNCLLVGHRDTTFVFLEELKKGDRITMENRDGQRGDFQVQELSVLPADKLYLRQVDECWLTLITCYPFHAVPPGTDRRYVVFAKGVALLTDKS